MIRGFADYTPPLDLECEVLILGAGAGGCAAACALAERGIDVLVVEEGSHWRPRDFKASNPWAFKNLYQDRGARVALGNGWLPVNGGRGVGGSTLINSAISFKTPPEIVSDWSIRCGFDPDGNFLSEHVARVWNTIGVIKNPESVQGQNNIVFKRGAEALGLKGEYLHRSAPGCVGCGVCQLGCPTGGKNSVDRTFLPLGLNTGNLRVFSDCRAERVEREGDRIVAVSGSVMNPEDESVAGTWRVRADRVLLSGGSIGSPRFLMKNGLAPNDHCGSHLHLHPASPVYAGFEEEIVHWKGVSQGYYVDRWEKGYLLQTATVTPDNNFLGLPLELGPDINEVMSRLRHVALAGALVHDEDTVGTVTEKGLFFEFGEHDRKVLLEGLRECCEVFFAAGAEWTVPAVIGAGFIRSPDDIAAAIPDDVPFDRMIAVASHPMGTNRIGHTPEDSVVDPRCKVWGLDNLYVADASVFPTALGVNPQVTVMAIGLMVGSTM
ncbi:MAG: GMC family oxidoreductase [Proteobacteria bacterium]|nr:GMC family oxidoreductase [Pseudomonadota bacterium]MCP4920390.1 GMC family oxidoreductase [Pseudomonadota bacterium]